MSDTILLYRCLDAAAALKTIESRLLRISRLRDLNDPFESRMGITGIIPEGESKVNAWLDSIRDQQHSMFGLLCFSNTPRESVLWSHYADKHRGVALEVKFDFHPDQVIEIHYPIERPTIDAKIYVKLRQDEAEFKRYLLSLLDLLIRRKSPGWAYEREYRVFFDIQNNKDLIMSGGHYFKRIPDNFLTRVILGWRCPLDEQYIIKALEVSGLTSTKVVRAKMSLDTYEVQC
jgi:hypothetical protein